MIKVFQTGDNHFGLKFNRYPDIKDQLVQARLTSLQNAVRLAESQACDLFVVTGDLFDTVTVAKKLVKQVVEVLAQFSGTVLILPGNHDYYAEGASVWEHYASVQPEVGGDLVLLNRFEPYEFDFNGQHLTVYPAYCQSKHSEENNLGWIKEQPLGEIPGWKIGVAHGAIQGVTPDLNQEYFLMSPQELEALDVDAWLIGHTHIPYPALTDADQSALETGRVYNAGTHEQTDLANNTSGLGFVITLDDAAGAKRVSARAVRTGQLAFADLPVDVRPDADDALEQAIRAAVSDLDPRSTIVRLSVSGSCRQVEYEGRKRLYEDLLGGFLSHEVRDTDLSEQVTMEKISDEFPSVSLAYQLLQELQDDPKELQMAYELLVQSKAE
ncbi:MAG: metallophosphoesterase [Coriobacteriia bacterium]|nr:metallophosphoesterase [Coriobacteriia bacterium]